VIVPHIAQAGDIAAALAASGMGMGMGAGPGRLTGRQGLFALGLLAVLTRATHIPDTPAAPAASRADLRARLAVAACRAGDLRDPDPCLSGPASLGELLQRLDTRLA